MGSTETIAKQWATGWEGGGSLGLSDGAPLPGPNQIGLENLIDPKTLLAQLDAITSLLATASTLLLSVPQEPDALEQTATLIRSDFFQILEDAAPAPLRPLRDAFHQAGQMALAAGSPVEAPSFLGAATLWACPLLLHFEKDAFAKGALVSFAFPVQEYPEAARLLEECPWLSPCSEALLRAARRLKTAALPAGRLPLVRRQIELLAAGLSREISARYEALLAFQSLAAQGEELRRQRMELDERNRVLGSLTRQYAVEKMQMLDDRALLEQRSLQAEAASGDLQRSLESLQAEQRWREELFREVSHDLKAPLTTIRAFAEILGTLDESEREQARDFQKIIKEEAERLAVLVDQVLDLARLEAGHGNLSPEPAHPAELIEQVARIYQARARESGFTLTTETSPDLPQVVWDRDGILRILINLVDNALRFIPSGGNVAIRAYPAPEPGQRAVILEVEDDGPGIPEENRTRVFQRFFTVPPKHGKHRGTGLGLAICRGIAEAHGGTIEADRGGLGGALFRLRLPVGTE